MKMQLRKKTMKRLPIVALLTVFLVPTLSLGQQVKDEKNPLGFRSDLGLSLTVGGHSCLGSSGTTWLECKGNNTGWSMGTGIALAAIIRPLKYFSMGLDATYMALRPTEGTSFDKVYNRFTDISLGGVFRGHLPINIKRMILDLSLGLKIAFVNGYLKAEPDADFQFYTGDDSSSYTHRHFGPELTPLFNADLFIIPKFGFGFELRVPMTLYQQVCFDQGNSVICRGTKDDSTDKVKSPAKMAYGLHLIYYL